MAAPLRLTIWKSTRWMCTGWNHPPDLFCNTHFSTVPTLGAAATRPFQGRPLMTHSPPLRSKTNRRGLRALTASFSSAPNS